jgi:putative membrane protein
MSKQILRGLIPASVAVCLLVFAVGCTSTQGGYGRGNDTTATGGTYGGTTGGNQGGDRTTTGNTGNTGVTTNDQGTQAGRSSASDATAIAKLKSADSSEVALSKYALDRISDARVKDFAQMLLDDHQKDLDKVNDLVSKHNITPMPPSNDSTEQHMDHAMNTLKSVDKGQTFDAAFLQLQINDHRETIDALKALQSLSLSDNVKSHIDNVLPKLQSHLDKAQDLVKDLGMSQTGR